MPDEESAEQRATNLQDWRILQLEKGLERVERVQATLATQADIARLERVQATLATQADIASLRSGIEAITKETRGSREWWIDKLIGPAVSGLIVLVGGSVVLYNLLPHPVLGH